MKTESLFVAFAGFALVSASPPPADPIPWEDAESIASYPPCSRTVTDRCIQTNERGRAARETVATRDAAPAAPAAAPTAVAARSDYPPCSRTVTDRCIQTRGGGETRMARTAPKPKYRAARTQLAMRAGERG